MQAAQAGSVSRACWWRHIHADLARSARDGRADLAPVCIYVSASNMHTTRTPDWQAACTAAAQCFANQLWLHGRGCLWPRWLPAALPLRDAVLQL